MNLMRHLRKKTEKSKQQGFQGANIRAFVAMLKRIQPMMQQKGGSSQIDIPKQEKGRLGLQQGCPGKGKESCFPWQN